jgi:2-polyprenyl-3-methyl-5-hydroxy-6-metoxy-1,4-benzoquinol methylase
MNEKLTSCPICREAYFQPFLTISDHFLSGEQFHIQECTACGFRFVNPRPGKDEIGRYYQSDAYISHNAARKDIISRIYKIARNISIKGKYNLVRRYCSGGSILDFGCGTGEFLAYCRKQGFEVTGLEPGATARSFAQQQNGIPVVDSMEQLLAQPVKFRCITLWHVLEHVHLLNETIAHLSDLLDTDGVLIVAVPNSNSPDARRYGTFWAAYDVPRHLYHFTEKTITGLFSRHHFHIAAILPQKLDAYYVSLLSEKYKKGKSNYLKSFISGFLSNFNASRPEHGYSSQIFVLKRDNP